MHLGRVPAGPAPPPSKRVADPELICCPELRVGAQLPPSILFPQNNLENLDREFEFYLLSFNQHPLSRGPSLCSVLGSTADTTMWETTTHGGRGWDVGVRARQKHGRGVSCSLWRVRESCSEQGAFALELEKQMGSFWRSGALDSSALCWIYFVVQRLGYFRVSEKLPLNQILGCENP